VAARTLALAGSTLTRRAKQTGPGGDKHKVFWVECGTTGPTGTTGTTETTPPSSGNTETASTTVSGVQTSPVAGVQGLPSTSTDGSPAIPLAALGLAMVGFGGMLLRGRRTRSQSAPSVPRQPCAEGSPNGLPFFFE
jgi:LPXTG-motif cell wall-anchored protein